MTGLELSRAYWEQVAAPELQAAFPALFPRVAAGLVGNGSECFGYDDELSRDHDWGVDFFLWVLEEDRASIPALSQWKQALMSRRPPEFPRVRSRYGGSVDVMTVGGFYRSLIGTPGIPEDMLQWRQAPEGNFAMAVNGAVFQDPPGQFSAVRRGLLDYYPEDLRRKKIAARCMALAQTGQYNFTRIARRKDWVTSQIVLTKFTHEAMGLAYHLNRVFRPYYKWTWRRLGELPILGRETANLLLELAQIQGWEASALERRQQKIDKLCSALAAELRRQGLSRTEDDFLAAHGEEVQRSIRHEWLRSLPAVYE